MEYPLIGISGPAGVGKTTVIKGLLQRFPSIRSSVTYTTRQKRSHSTEDKIMQYVSRHEFEERLNAKEFMEWALVHGEYYGTHAEETEQLLKTNPVLLNIDVQGMEQIKKTYGDRVITIFIAPESMDQIVHRMKKRGDITPDQMDKRIASARQELARKGEYDYCVVNSEGKLEDTISKIVDILGARVSS